MPVNLSWDDFPVTHWITLNDGKTRQEVRGRKAGESGCFRIHPVVRDTEAAEELRFAVDHLPTGLGVGQFPTIEHAEAFVAACEDVMPIRQWRGLDNRVIIDPKVAEALQTERARLGHTAFDAYYPGEYVEVPPPPAEVFS